MTSAFNGNIFNHTVNDVGPDSGEQVVMLPLNLIALIVSYVRLQYHPVGTLGLVNASKTAR